MEVPLERRRFLAAVAASGLPLSSASSSVPPTTVSVADLGLTGKGENATAVVAEAYDRLAKRGGGTLYFPAGDYRLNLELTSRSIHLTGAGRGATRLSAADRALPVLRATYADVQWQYVTISALDLIGFGGADEIGFMAGHEPPRSGDELAGRTRFVDVGFRGFARCLARPAGQIGLTLRDCQFGDADYHLWCASYQRENAIMHSGVALADGCYFSGARKASLYVDSPVPGSGQITFRDCVFENNPGLILSVRAFNNVDSTPAIALTNCWNEQNGSGQAVIGASTGGRPCFADLRATVVQFTNTPLGPLRLRQTAVTTVDCPLDQLGWVDTDPASVLLHHRARGFGSFVPVGKVASVAASLQTNPGRSLTFALRDRRKPTRIGSGIVLFEAGGETGAAITLSGRKSGTQTAGRLRLEAGAIAAIGSVSVDPQRWLVWLVTARALGPGVPVLELTGSDGIFQPVPIKPSAFEMQTFGGYGPVTDGARQIGFCFTAPAGEEATIEVAALHLLAFPSAQAAIECLNANIA